MVPMSKSEAFPEIYVSQIVPTLILEAITLCMVVEMKSPVYGSDINAEADIHIRSD